MNPADALGWWQRRPFVALLALLATMPLWWPDVPPLVDLPGHMGRYRVQLDGGATPHLSAWYDFRWQLIGNLGVDLLVQLLAPFLGLERAVKLVVLCIPALIVAGLLWIAREVHGRVPATALFALPLAYSFPFHFGFVNFALSMGLALNAFALWLRLARLGRLRLRAALFVPISCVLWVCHTFGWGVLGVLAFSAEMIRQADRRAGERWWRRWGASWVFAGIACLPLALPMALMVLWRSGDHVTGKTGDWFNWRAKFSYVTMVLRDRWMAWDIASAAVLYFILFKAVRDERVEYSRNLLMSSLFLLAVFVALPRVVFGSAYADMRLIPFVLAVALVAIRPKRGLAPRGASALAGMALLFFLARLVGTTASFVQYDRSYDRALAALPRVPVAARTVSFVGRRCVDDWAYTRLEHVPALGLVRRLAYSNDQWSMAGAQLLTTRLPAGFFANDPSQVVTDRQCSYERWLPIDRALATFPRDRFDHVWLLAPPPFDPAAARGLTLLWSNGRDRLYRVQPARLNGVNASR